MALVPPLNSLKIKTRQSYVKRAAPTIFPIKIYLSRIDVPHTIATSIYQHLMRCFFVVVAYFELLKEKIAGKTPYRNTSMEASTKTACRRIRHPCHLQTNSKQLC